MSKKKPTAYQIFRFFEDHVYLPRMTRPADPALRDALTLLHRALRETASEGQ